MADRTGTLRHHRFPIRPDGQHNPGLEWRRPNRRCTPTLKCLLPPRQDRGYQRDFQRRKATGSRLTDPSLYAFLFSSLVAVLAQYVRHEFASSTYCASRSHLHAASLHAGCGGPGGIGEVFVNGIPGFSSFLQEQPSLVDLCTISSRAIHLHQRSLWASEFYEGPSWIASLAARTLLGHEGARSFFLASQPSNSSRIASILESGFEDDAISACRFWYSISCRPRSRLPLRPTRIVLPDMHHTAAPFNGCPHDTVDDPYLERAAMNDVRTEATRLGCKYVSEPHLPPGINATGCLSQDLLLDRQVPLNGCYQLVCCPDDVGLVLGENIGQIPACQADKESQIVDHRGEGRMATWVDMLYRQMRRQLVTTETTMNPSCFPKNDINEHNREPELQDLEKVSSRFPLRQRVFTTDARGLQEHMPVNKLVNEESSASRQVLAFVRWGPCSVHVSAIPGHPDHADGAVSWRIVCLSSIET
ncbi:hypothetical protein HD553DRAFT_325157 [Filobasidium floriforme]|uniref:uncharacterized protein n=1 Tax=Filobasidium floriforme TaxID=5210 RepID=UPI001E8D61CC|nr:uncharacterized protein HD553DRAFT_325157 [Filobasidium floriforme]KAH8082329.1 hypothetical protein HD553DRAFT_325157 [Filobasidium floriforme]